MPRPLRALLVIAIAALPLAAQAPAQRTQIEIFRDSLATVKDSVALLVLEKQLIAHASHELRDSAMVHLQLGFIAARLGDLTGKKHFEDAASEFQWVTELQPKWPYGWFGLGIAELGVGDAEFAVLRGLQTALGKDALTRSANDFAKSAEVDPGFVRGLIELTNTALRQRINLRMDVALAALRRSGHTPAARNSDVLLARARIEREVGSPDSALAAIDSLVAHSPADPTALLEQARVRFRLGRRDGGDPWYRGLAGADPAALALYRGDLLFVMPDSSLHAFDAARGEARATLMRHFWDFRDSDELHNAGERLVEHYRRLEYARHNYRLASIHRHYDIVERYRPPVAEFDDRGVVYIRQGTPDDRASAQLPDLPFNESWVYHRQGETDLLFHFVAREGVTDFRLVESALDILGYANAVKLANSGDVQGTYLPLRSRLGRLSADSAAKLRERLSNARVSSEAEAILRSRERLNPVYQRLLAAGTAGASGIEGEERQLGIRSIKVGTTTDNWPRHYAVALQADVQVLAAGGDSISPMVQIAFAIPAGAGAVAGRSSSIRLRASVLSQDGRVVAAIDTIGPLATGASSGTHGYLFGLIPLRISAGKFTIRVGLETNGAGVVSERDTVEAPSPIGAGFGVSDLVLGNSSVPLSWTRTPPDTVWVNPTVEFRMGQPMQTYFEIGASPHDSIYKIELTVKRPGSTSVLRRILGIFGASSTAFRAAWTQRTTGPLATVRRDLDLDKLKPGRYVLEVVVTAPAGEKRTRRQEFSVVR